MSYKLYNSRRIIIDNKTMDLIINKFNKVNNKSGTLFDNITYSFINKGGQGEVFSVCMEENKCLAIKRGKLSENEQKLLIIMSGYVTSHISPHFLLIYKIDRISNNVFILMEKIDGNLNKWLILPHDENEWLSFLFQFTMGIYVMKTYGKTYHADLKPKNILFKNIDEQQHTCAKYTINLKGTTTDYYVPFYGKLFIIADFGHSQSLLLTSNKLSSNEIKHNLDVNTDLYHIYTLAKRLIVDTIIKNYNLSAILDFLNKYNVSYRGYYEKEKEKINNYLRQYPPHMKDYMLLKALAYFVIENELYDKLDISIKSEFHLPPISIQKLIIENFDGKLNPEDIIEKCFDKYKKKDESCEMIDNYVL